MFRKRLRRAYRRDSPLPVLFLVHGSSLSSVPNFDLKVPGKSGYSLMDEFAGFGFDVWTMDFEGYGKSSLSTGKFQHRRRRGRFESRCRSGGRMRPGSSAYHFFGESSGALRVGAYAMEAPERVNRLVLAAFTYTGEGSRHFADRAKQIDFYRTNNRRPRDRDMIRSIFTRDKVGTADPAVAEALADMELPLGDTVPTGNVPRHDRQPAGGGSAQGARARADGARGIRRHRHQRGLAQLL